jgi:serine/threonine protein kinase
MASVPRRVGRYEIIREIGRGGMALVYLARQVGPVREVALKELFTFHASDPEAAERFVQESELAASLNHPNVVTVYDYVEYEGIPYIAMEYLPRGSLRPLMDQLTLAQIAGVFEGVLAALAEAETLEIVHRDLKPENLMVSSDGRVKITDFGIAKAVRRTTGRFLTAAGTTIGTPVYMAPEQAMGRGIGPWSDLYSVGVIAYELLLRRLPFEETEPPLAIMHHHVYDPIPPPASVDPDLDPRLDAWIERLLQKVPADRYQGAVDAWHDLEDVITDIEGPYWRRQARLARPVGALGPKSLLSLSPAPFPSPNPPVVPRPDLAPEPEDPLVHEYRTVYPPPPRPPPVEEVLPPEPPTPEEVPRPEPPPEPELLTVQRTPGSRVQAESPDSAPKPLGAGKPVQEAAKKRGRWKWLVPASVVALGLAAAGVVIFLPLGPPGPSMRQQIVFMNPKGTQLRTITGTSKESLYQPSWNNDSSHIAFVVDRGSLRKEIHTASINGGDQRRLTSGSTDTRPAWSPDGQWIAFDRTVDGQSTIWRVDTRGQQLSQIGPGGSNSPTWSPDSRMIAFVRASQIWVMNSDGTEEEPALPGSTLSRTLPAWAPIPSNNVGAGRIAFLQQKRRALQVWVADRVPPTSCALTDPGVGSNPLAWTPDGTNILFTLGGIPYEVAVPTTLTPSNHTCASTSRPRPLFQGPTVMGMAATISPDGNIIALVRTISSSSPSPSPSGTALATPGSYGSNPFSWAADLPHRRPDHLLQLWKPRRNAPPSA